MSRVVVNEIEAKVGNDITFNDTVKIDTLKGKTDVHNITINKSAAKTMILRTGIAPTWSYNNSSASPIDGINISSGTDNGTGDYTFTYTNNHDDTTPSAQCTNNTEGNYILICHATTTTTIRVRSRSDSTADHDDTSMFTIHGELA